MSPFTSSQPPGTNRPLATYDGIWGELNFRDERNYLSSCANQDNLGFEPNIERACAVADTVVT